MGLRLHILSDLHLEFHRDGGYAFIDSLPVPEVDAVVLAGDIGNIRALSHLTDVLRRICSRYQRAYFVFGNHEFYGSSLSQQDAAKSWLERSIGNLRVLTDEAVTDQGRRILGGTLWFPFRPDDVLYRSAVSDFSQIRDWQAIAAHHDAFMRMAETIQPGDIVISHHIPAPQSVAAPYVGSEMNRFFMFDLSKLIEEKKPALWVHGHTHFCFDYVLGQTRVVCNPFGYPTEGTAFREDLVVEV